MKKQSNSQQNPVGKVQLENITGIITGHLSTVLNQSACKIFTTADLWNIQRKGTSGLQRRHSF
jgi:hypothetical protein